MQETTSRHGALPTRATLTNFRPHCRPLREEADNVVDCWRRFRVADAERQELLNLSRYQFAHSKTLKAGCDPEKLKAVEELLFKDGARTRTPAANDPLYPTFKLFAGFYKQATHEINIPGPNWDITTTDGLSKEIDAFEQRVKEAKEKVKLLEASIPSLLIY